MGILKNRLADLVFALFFALFVAVSVLVECPVCLGEKVSPDSSLAAIRESYTWGLKVHQRALRGGGKAQSLLTWLDGLLSLLKSGGYSVGTPAQMVPRGSVLSRLWLCTFLCSLCHWFSLPTEFHKSACAADRSR